MTKNIFISYSRRELGFVDDIVDDLENEGYNVWLDYRALVPGIPWKEQIDKGLNDSDTVLLVVSKAALASEYVALEWRHFLETNKRVILLIFEAVDLPPELEKYEWVDFRSNYKAGMAELFSQLKKPIQEEHPVPETGFKAPPIVWIAVILSAIVGLLSLAELWTLFIPWLLVPLPYKIIKRNFNFTQVQTALWALPFASFISLMVYDDPALDIVVFLALVLGIALLFVLRSKAMQRWGKPEAIIPKYIEVHDVKIEKPETVPFYVDYAPEDRVIAEEMIATFKKYGHPQAESIQQAKAVFVLISSFKSDTEAAPEKQVVFPVMVQTNYDIAKKLSKIQWIDFRPGVRGLDTMAKLIAHPKEMLKALGMRPVSSQTVYSPVITTLYFFIIFLGVITIGSAVDYILSPITMDISNEAFGSVLMNFVLNILAFFALAFFMLRGLTTRKGIFSSFWSIVVGILILGVLLLSIVNVEQTIIADLEMAGFDEVEIGSSFIQVPFMIYFLGIFAIGFTIFRNRKDIGRWFPSRKKA